MAKGTPKLVIVSTDASEQTKKKLTVKSDFYRIPYIVTEISSAEIAKMLGKSYAPMAVAITDSGFAQEIKKALLPETTI